MGTTKSWPKRIEYSNSLKHGVQMTYHAAVEKHYSHEKMLEMRDLCLFSNDKYKALPMYMQSQLTSYFDALLDLMWSHVEWVFWYDGVFVGKNLNYGTGFDQSKVEAAHCYKGTEDCFTERKHI